MFHCRHFDMSQNKLVCHEQMLFWLLCCGSHVPSVMQGPNGQNGWLLGWTCNQGGGMTVVPSLPEALSCSPFFQTFGNHSIGESCGEDQCDFNTELSGMVVTE
jgi:hypothetical protein